MLHYDRIYVSEGIDINKTSTSKKCDICHYWYFLDKKFNFQPDVCNRCHDVLMMSLNPNNIDILNVWVFIIIVSLTEQIWCCKFTAKCWFDWEKWNIIENKNFKNY